MIVRLLGLLRFVACAALIVLATRPARADAEADIARAKASFKAGATAYGAGDYAAAIQALEAAYAITPLPAIAFSLAQAHRRQYFATHDAQNLKAAVELFRRYVSEVPRGGRRPDALDALSQLEPLLLAERPAQQAIPSGPSDKPTTRIMITCEAPSASVSLDGGPKSPAPLIREVPPGKHRVSVSAAGFFPVERDVLAVAGELVLAEVALREQPGLVDVWLPRDADLYVDGVSVNYQGAHARLRLQRGRHHLAVAKKGRELWAQTVTVERGKPQSLRVVLEQTVQRTAALSLFIAGSAALGTSFVLSAFAIQGENRAEEFLGKQKRGNVSPAELGDYHEAIEQRGRFRAATALTLMASAGLFITGVFLHEIDHPTPQRSYRLGARDTRRIAKRESSGQGLKFAPLVGPGTGGAVLSASF